MYNLPRNYSFHDSELFYCGHNMNALVQKYDTPLRVHFPYLLTHNYRFLKSTARMVLEHLELSINSYECGYAIKANQSYRLIAQAVANTDFIEVSSANDLTLLEELAGTLGDKKIICHGFKPSKTQYFENIIKLRNLGFNIIPVIDSVEELRAFRESGVTLNIGVRFESPYNLDGRLVTERFGLSHKEFAQHLDEITSAPNLNLVLLHIHVSNTLTNIKQRLRKQNSLFTIFKLCREKGIDIKYLDFGGSLPDRSHTDDAFYVSYFEHLFGYLKKNTRETPIIMNELGRFLAAETQCIILKVTKVKKNNAHFTWYLAAGSAVNLIPEIFIDNTKRFEILPVNHTDRQTIPVICAGTTCDPEDYFNNELIQLPKIAAGEELYILLPNTGAYQESLQGAGRGAPGHCLIENTTDIIFNEDGTNEKTATSLNLPAALGFPQKTSTTPIPSKEIYTPWFKKIFGF